MMHTHGDKAMVVLLPPGFACAMPHHDVPGALSFPTESVLLSNALAGDGMPPSCVSALT